MPGTRAARSRRQIDPAVVDAGDINDAGDAGQQHLAERHLLAGLARHRIGLQRDRALLETAHVHRGNAVLLAHAAIERLGARVRMQVDQAGITIRSVPSIVVSAVPS